MDPEQVYCLLCFRGQTYLGGDAMMDAGWRPINGPEISQPGWVCPGCIKYTEAEE